MGDVLFLPAEVGSLQCNNFMNNLWAIRTLNYYTSPYYKKELANWATFEERVLYKRLHSQKRKQDWLLGRFTAKELIQKY